MCCGGNECEPREWSIKRTLKDGWYSIDLYALTSVEMLVLSMVQLPGVLKKGLCSLISDAPCLWFEECNPWLAESRENKTIFGSPSPAIFSSNQRHHHQRMTEHPNLETRLTRWMRKAWGVFHVAICRCRYALHIRPTPNRNNRRNSLRNTMLDVIYCQISSIKTGSWCRCLGWCSCTSNSSCKKLFLSG